jgi:hypothetical protein
VVGQHDAAGTDPDRARAARDIADDDGGRGAGDPDHVVVFGHPVTVVPPGFGMLGKIQGVAQRVGRRKSLGDGCEIEHG